MTVNGSGLKIDLTGSHPQVRGFVNSVATNTISNIYSALVALCPDIPVNSGYFRPVEIVLPPHSVVNCDAPAPVGNSTVCIGSDIMEAVMKAFEGVVPDLVGSANIDLVNVRVSGTNSRSGRFFVASDITATAMSAGGAKGTDGWGGYAAPFCALKLPSLEMYEQQYPWQYLEVEYEIDTAAPGEFRGAPALHYRRRMLDPVKAIVYGQGWRHPMQGYIGGRSGAGNFFLLNQRAQMSLPLRTRYATCRCAGEHHSRKAAGGGWGGSRLHAPPRTRADDVRDGYVRSMARAEYSVSHRCRGMIPSTLPRPRRPLLQPAGRKECRIMRGRSYIDAGVVVNTFTEASHP